MSTPTAATQFDTATNRLQQESNGQPLPPNAYDAQGNLTNHPWIGQMSYDGEGQIWRHIKGGTTVEFTYDGEGRRVKKRVGTAPPTIYVYDATGQLAADYGTADGTLNCGTCYITADHLGSTRLTTGATGDTAEPRCIDYFPFGEEIPRPGVDCYTPTTEPRQKFTGKERDQETDLDYFIARYYSGGQGRFTSPDLPFADQHVEDPQSWNLYSYVRNNPLRYTDPTGRCLRPNETLESCGDYLLGALKTVANIPSDTVNLPNRLANVFITPFTDFRFQDLVPTTFQPTNTDQAQGMEAMGVALIATPLAEAAVGKVAKLSQGARTAEVVIDSAKSPQAAAHIKDAQAGGQPAVVTLDRSLARPNRKAALADTPAPPRGSGLARDEYPPACCREGGVGSSVRVIQGRDNSSAGAQFGNQVRRLTDGTKVRIKVK